MNWEFIEKYLPLYQKAAVLTVKIGLLGIVFAILVGLVCAVVLYYRVNIARQIVSFYIELSRNTPLLVQLFFIYDLTVTNGAHTLSKQLIPGKGRCLTAGKEPFGIHGDLLFQIPHTEITSQLHTEAFSGVGDQQLQ